MDPNSSLEKICLGDDVVVISSDKVEGPGDWNSPEYQDTTGSKGKKVMNAVSFHKMEADEISERTYCCLKGELYFVKFIINPEEDDFEPGVIFGRSFPRLAKGVVDFGKSSDNWDQLLDFNFDDVTKFGEELPPFVCKMRRETVTKREK
uniref:Uncharacterized protein n=1 Tax=Tanacetum cinerariifolium TaxID=118510 RepID=A0A699QCU5_TANCI|nr:hypothetical protein [Tanacetum cinerariifolium]